VKPSLTRSTGLAALAALTVTITLAVPSAGSPPTTTPTDTPGTGVTSPTRHRSGLTLLPVPRPPAPLPETLATALSDAQRLAGEHPKDFGYAWVDRATGRVMLDVATDNGRRLAEHLTAPPDTSRTASRGDTAAAAPRPRLRQAARPQADLERVKDEVIALDGVWVAEVDPQTARVVVTVTKLSDALAARITKAYGTDTVTVRVDPGYQPGSTAARSSDSSPFWGGSYIITPTGTVCTAGFPWESSEGTHMLTAGHCAPYGGSVSTPATSMGWVTPGSRETWTKGTGTVYLSGQSRYRGDLALIDTDSGKSVSPSIYTGERDYRRVREMIGRYVQVGDEYCTAGISSGAVCGWEVIATGVNYKYGGTGETVRNVVRGEKTSGRCILGGDSGGPVYGVNPDGTVTASGITSGVTGGGGSDSIGGWIDPCNHVFTDINEAFWGFPGHLQTT